MICKKVKFSSEDYAIFHIKKYSKKYDKESFAYKCKCGSWHLTTMIQYNALIEDNETLRSQLIEQIKINAELKEEIKHVVKKQKSKLISSTDLEILRKTLRKKKDECKQLRKTRDELFSTLRKLELRL